MAMHQPDNLGEIGLVGFVEQAADLALDCVFAQSEFEGQPCPGNSVHSNGEQLLFPLTKLVAVCDVCCRLPKLVAFACQGCLYLQGEVLEIGDAVLSGNNRNPCEMGGIDRIDVAFARNQQDWQFWVLASQVGQQIKAIAIT